jgi:hypothetical protein
MKAQDEFENIPVFVSFEDRRAKKTILEYRLNVTSFGSVSRAELHFVGEV